MQSLKKLAVLVVLGCLFVVLPAGAQEKKKRRVADKKFWIAAAVLAGAALADGISTSRLHNRCSVCKEANPLFPPRPSNRTLFGRGAAIVAGEIGVMYLLKRYGPGESWALIPIVQVPLHVTFTIQNAREPGDRPSVCPSGTTCNGVPR